MIQKNDQEGYAAFNPVTLMDFIQSLGFWPGEKRAERKEAAVTSV